MARKYETPKAEKVEFNYQDTIVASDFGLILKRQAHGGNGCYNGKNNGDGACAVYT